MNGSLKVVVSAGLLAMLIVGCGSDGASQNVSSSDLKGNWTICDIAIDGGSSEQDNLKFTDNELNRRHVEYSNGSCNNIASDILFDVTYIYSYSLGDDFKTEAGRETTKIDLTLKGFIDNKENFPTTPTTGVTSYDITYIENKKLFHGKAEADHNGTSDATRPVAIDFLDPAVKQ
jgi:hypothetical protein